MIKKPTWHRFDFIDLGQKRYKILLKSIRMRLVMFSLLSYIILEVRGRIRIYISFINNEDECCCTLNPL